MEVTFTPNFSTALWTIGTLLNPFEDAVPMINMTTI
jgi:hypothetical protein